MKKAALAVLLVFVLALLATSVAMAAPSPCGAAHGAFANDNGNFGWLGPLGGTPGYHGAVGQEADATGYNNSHTGCNS